MPKNQIYKETIDKDIFIEVLEYRGISIRKLGDVESIDCTERTIRRSLHEKRMTPIFLDQIAKYLDIDPRYLSGELHRKARSVTNQVLKEQWLRRLNPHDFPYFRKVQDDQRMKPIKELLESMFSLFDISYNQFESLEFEKQYELQHEIFDSIIPVIKKYFIEDGYGQKGLLDLDKIVFNLENYRDDYYESLYADTILREKFAENPPHGVTRKKILSMSPEELIGLDLYEQSKNDEQSEFEKKLFEKYSKVNKNEESQEN